MTLRARITGFTVMLVLALLLSSAGQAVFTVRAEDAPPLPVPHQLFNGVSGLQSDAGAGTFGISNYKNPPSPICTTSGTGANVNTDCEKVNPHNETSIAVDPNNPLHMVSSANDYQLRLNTGGRVYETVLSRAHVTWDGGQTWTVYPVPFKNYAATGDPAVAFDASGRVYLATLGFLWSQGNGCCTNPDIVVSSSGDGGVTWSNPTRVAQGTGSFGSPGILNDKEYLTAWGNGNAIVTWTYYMDGIGGSYLGSPIYASVTHNGGKTWSAPVEISGSAAFCAGFNGGNACDQDQGSVPAVGADGSIYVGFVNYDNNSAGRDQYLVVQVDPATGQRIAGPYQAGGVVDGFTDYPISIDGRQTYQDSQFRTWAVGNLTADPTTAGHLALVWSDMRNSQLPAPRDPYQAVTNSDVIVTQSFDGGATWSAPAALTIPNDQFMPWGAYGPNGLLRIGYFDRSYDPANHAYGYTIASETSAGSLAFSYTQISTALSDPTQNTRWFSGRTPNPSFPHPTTFMGDYSNIATSPAGVAALWTDMRDQACFGTRCDAGENSYFGMLP